MPLPRRGRPSVDACCAGRKFVPERRFDPLPNEAGPLPLAQDVVEAERIVRGMMISAFGDGLLSHSFVFIVRPPLGRGEQVQLGEPMAEARHCHGAHYVRHVVHD